MSRNTCSCQEKLVHVRYIKFVLDFDFDFLALISEQKNMCQVYLLSAITMIGKEKLKPCKCQKELNVRKFKLINIFDIL